MQSFQRRISGFFSEVFLKIRTLWTLIFILVTGTLPLVAHSQNKFKRALVISGGGIAPGMALGLIHGAKAAGYHPDIIIVTCGASIGAGIAHSYPDHQQAKDFLTSPEFYQILVNNVSIDTRFVFPILTKLEKATQDLTRMPYLFSDTILDAPERLESFLPGDKFTNTKNKPRYLVLAAKANFGPNDFDHSLHGGAFFKQVYFTDADTAQKLKNFPSPIQRLFPDSRVEKTTEVISNVSFTEAVRASISDPILINPAKIGNDYYFSGGVDLFPVETAQALADEVLITYPSGLYPTLIDMTIYTTFGFSQSNRALAAGRAKDVRWIDVQGLEKIVFDPQAHGMLILNHIPDSFAEFNQLTKEQYSLGYHRALEAVKTKPGTKNNRSHLRKVLPDIYKVEYPSK